MSPAPTKLIVLPLSILVAAIILLAAFKGGTGHAMQFVEDARGCDWFGYLRQARLFQQHGPIGGLDTAIRDDRTRYLVGVAKATGLDPDVWDYGVAPYCHHYKPQTDRVVLQYPPGTGFLHALWPEGRQARWTFVACGIALLLILGKVIVAARAAIVPLLAAGLGVLCFGGMYAFDYDRSIPPTIVMALGLGQLTVAMAMADEPRRQTLLAGGFGLLVGLSAAIRLPNILLAAGPLVVLAVTFLRRPSEDAAVSFASLVLMALVGLLPVFAANAINAGHPLATTYGSIDTSLPRTGWDELARGLTFYFFDEVASAAFVVVALLACLGVWVGAGSRHRGLAAATAMGLVSLLVSSGFFVSHEPLIRYYLFPAAVYATAVAFYCVADVKKTGAKDRPIWRFMRAARLTLVAATCVIVLLICRQLSVPLSPYYAAPDVTFSIDPRAVVWADRSTGNIVHFLGRQAAVFTFLSRDIRDRFVADIARDGVTQYFVIDSAHMENAVAPFRQHEGFRLAGKTFGYDTFVIAPRLHADKADSGASGNVAEQGVIARW